MHHPHDDRPRLCDLRQPDGGGASVTAGRPEPASARFRSRATACGSSSGGSARAASAGSARASDYAECALTSAARECTAAATTKTARAGARSSAARSARAACSRCTCIEAERPETTFIGRPCRQTR